MRSLARRRAVAPLALTALLALSACEPPVPPTWPVPEGAAQVAPTTTPLDLATELGTLPDAERLSLPAAGATLRAAYDGKRLLAQIEGAEYSAACPLVVYVATGAGAQRHELRFADARTHGAFINGGAFQGTAPRTRVLDDGTARFYLPLLGGDAAIHVETCRSQLGLPTLVLDLTRHDGFRWARATAPTIVGVRAPSAVDAPIGADKARWQPGETALLVGHGLDRVTALRFAETDVTPELVDPVHLRVTAPADGGDTDTVVPYVGPDALPAIAFAVEGSVHRIGDAMGTFSDAVWDTWLVLILVGAGLLLTIINGFPQFRGFRHAFAVIRGKYDNPDEPGEINHFQALTAALSATVGLGNIAGVAVAVTQGGPGALFWMWVCGFLGMATKFSECTLSTAYREVREDGTVAGGPMYYMRKELHRYLKPLAWVFAGFIMLSSFGGGNMFQANQAAALWDANFGIAPWVTGLILCGLVAVVIIGGIKRIGRVTDKLVPIMCGLYVAGALVIIGMNITAVPAVFGQIFSEAFSVSAAVGGALGIAIKEVIIGGFRRAAFSNEAGFGSAAIAHAAVKTDEPVREGVVALLEPFIDTIVICTMTGLVIIFSGLWTQQGLEGASLTSAAFDTAFDGFGSYLIPIAVFLFAISTMISWSYYGEKGVEFLFGRRAIFPYRILFVVMVFIGAVWKLGPVLNFSDAMFGLVAVPNLIAVLFLVPKLRRLTKDYFGRLRAGTMVEYK